MAALPLPATHIYIAIPHSSECFSHTSLLPTSGSVGLHSLGTYCCLCPECFNNYPLEFQVTQMSIPEAFPDYLI